MKLCARHISELINALKTKGLYHRVDMTHSVVQERMRKWLAGISSPSEIDPLLVSVMEINKKAVELLGYKFTQLKPNREHYCPLCEVNKLLKRNADTSWIDNVTDAQVSLFLQNGIPRKIER